MSGLRRGKSQVRLWRDSSALLGCAGQSDDAILSTCICQQSAACLSIGVISHWIYLSFRSADTEAPDQRTRYLKKKKNKKKKKKKKLVESGGGGDPEANVSSESLEEVKSESLEHGKPNILISCGSDNCQKKFTSESALKYHVTFAHERIQTVLTDSNSTSDKNVSNTNVGSDHRNGNTPEATNDTNSFNSENDPNEMERERLSETNLIKTERIKPKTFPSTQNIRPILPTQAQSPQIAGSLLKPIQPKPTILPPPTKNLNLDNLKKPLLAKTPGSLKSEQSTERDKELTATATAMDLTVPSPPGKPKTPIISVKSEFNTGNKQSLSDKVDKEELEVLKHISKPGMSVFNPLLPGASEYLSLLPPSFMLPPSSTASHLLPGLMGLAGPPPPSAPLSPFGASLESLARAAEERARSFGPPAHSAPHLAGLPGAAGRSPGAGAGGGGGGGAAGGGGGGGGGAPASTSEAGDAPLLRHEHMHTHLHYIPSPTHP